MEHLKYIAVHHSGGTKSNDNASSFGLTLSQLDQDHKVRWPDFKSQLGYYVGYNFVIFPDGTIKQTRKIGEETAAQLGHNFDTVSICMIGNYNIGSPDKMTSLTIGALKNILTALLEQDFGAYAVIPGTTFDFSIGHIMPHRCTQQAGYTECYGTSLSDTWARDLVLDEYVQRASSVPALAKFLAKISTLIASWQLAGSPPPSVGRSCGFYQGK